MNCDVKHHVTKLSPKTHLAKALLDDEMTFNEPPSQCGSDTFLVQNNTLMCPAAQISLRTFHYFQEQNC